jgi:hypothetical protein
LNLISECRYAGSQSYDCSQDKKFLFHKFSRHPSAIYSAPGVITAFAVSKCAGFTQRRFDSSTGLHYAMV